MQKVDVEVQPRPGTGKGPARRLRATGRLPVTLYGEDKPPLSLSVDRHSFHHMIASEGGRHAILTLKMAEGDALGIVKDVQVHPLTGIPVHADLQRISMDRKVATSVALHFEGTPDGVRNAGGVLETPLRELEIECLPGDIPDFVAVNVEPLGIGQTIHARDIVVDPRITLLTNPEATVASVLAPTLEKAEVPVEAAPEGEAEAAEAAKESA